MGEWFGDIQWAFMCGPFFPVRDAKAIHPACMGWLSVACETFIYTCFCDLDIVGLGMRLWIVQTNKTNCFFLQH